MPTAEWTPELEQWLQQQALTYGFDTAGISVVESPADQLTAERFTSWIDQGRAGEMDYLKRRDPQGVLLRTDIHTSIPWARSIIVCAFNYNTDAPLSIHPSAPGTGWIARYAQSGSDQDPQSESDQNRQSSSDRIPQSSADPHPEPTSNPLHRSGSVQQATTPQLQPTDYHHELLTRLQLLESALQQKLPCQTRCYVDTGPLIERAAAANAGIGWIGKNTCVLNQHLGSWLLLGVIITSLPVASNLPLKAAPDRCGSCTRCIDACPTDALIAPRQMDASRCISYLTIEKKGSIPEPLRPLIGRQVFGCDICQDVCPWNRDHSNRDSSTLATNNSESHHRPPIALKPGMLPRAELINPPLDWLAAMDAQTFKHYFRNSPLERARRKRILRNVAIAMGNSGEQKFLPTLNAWAEAVQQDPILAETAQWAIHQLEHKPNPNEPSPKPLC